MTVMPRLFTLVALAASVIPFATAMSCPSNHFSYSALDVNLCISIGGSDPHKGTAPSGKSCPSNWFWHTESSCCVPSTPSYPPSPSCSGSSLWDKGEQCCKSGGSGPTTSKPVPTTTKPAPTTTKPAPPATTSPAECNGGDFLWSALKGKCCIPHGGNPSPPSPPSGSSCPHDQGWYWHPGQGCCVPSHPSPPTPTCPPGAWWGNQCCNHNPAPPKPSGHSQGWKRSQKKRTVSRCPIGLEACPVGGLTGLTTEFECVDTTQDLQSCGGCASVHPELDCTTITGSWNVGCDHGACRVYSCQPGYKVSSDGTSCVKLN